MKKKVVVLNRVSTDRQDFESQNDAICEYIKKNNIVVDEFLTEQGVSGYSNKLYDREAIRRIEELALLGELDSLIIFNLDRLGRTTEVEQFIKKLTFAEVKVISVTEGQLNKGDDTDNLMNYLKSFYAEQESKKIGLRSKYGVEAANKDGRYQGGTITYGYDVVDKRLVINKEEAEIVKLIFELYNTTGKSATVKYLRENGLKKRNNEFSSNNVGNILRDTTYIGLKRYGHNVRISNDPTVKTRKRDYNSSKFQPYNESIRIISDELFYKTQDKIDNRRPKKGEAVKNSLRSKALLESLLYHVCGDGEIRKLHIDWKKDKYDNKTLLYRCSHCKRNFYTDVKKNYTGKFIEEEVEAMVLEDMENISIEELKERVKNDVNNKYTILKSNIKKIETSIGKKEKALINAKVELENIFLGDSDMDKSVVNSIIIKLDKEIEELKEGLKTEIKKLENVEYRSQFSNSLIEKYSKFCYAYRKADLNERKILLQEIIEKIVIDGENIDIYYYSY